MAGVKAFTDTGVGGFYSEEQNQMLTQLSQQAGAGSPHWSWLRIGMVRDWIPVHMVGTTPAFRPRARLGGAASRHWLLMTGVYSGWSVPLLYQQNPMSITLCESKLMPAGRAKIPSSLTGSELTINPR